MLYLLIHILSARHEVNFSVAQAAMAAFGDAIDVKEEIHGFRWVEERDLSGFVDGTENPAGEETRREVAVIKDGVDAGGSYVFDSLADDSTSRSTVTMEMEKFYTEAKDADVIIYNATIDGGVGSVDELVAKNSLLANFKAVREGNVWTTDQDMYQQMMNTGAIISDLHRVLTEPDAMQLTYLKRLG